MKLFRALRGDRSQAAPAARTGLPHADPELEARLPATILGRATTKLSLRAEAGDEYTRWWLSGVAEFLGVSLDAITIGHAGIPGGFEGIRAYRFAGVAQGALEKALEADSWTDRTLAGGDNARRFGDVTLLRGVAGERELRVAEDGSIEAADDTPPDPAAVHHDLVDGDVWFQIFAGDDAAWIGDAARQIGPLRTT
jgi:hypothetical protein